MAKRQSRPSSNPERKKIASRRELNAFLGKLAKLQPPVDDDEETDRQDAIRSSLQQIDRQTFQSLIARAYADALKSPGQKLGTARPPSGGKSPGEKPAAKSKDRPASKKRRPRRRRASR
jgi:hypothetical protein